MPMLLPQLRVARSAFYWRFWKKAFIAVMNGVVGVVRNRDQIFWIENAWISGLDLLQRDRVQMVDVKTLMDLESRHTHVASIITSDNFVPYFSPFL